MQHSILNSLTGASAAFRQDIEEPIRSELFSIERLEQHAESLAVAQRITTTPRTGRQLTTRLHDNARMLLKAYHAIAEAIRAERAITPAAEWLVDNFHIVEDQIREIRDDLPAGFYRQLPKLAEGHLQGYPRVFGLAWAFVAHTDSRFDPQALTRFVRAYQRVQPLTIGELWAVAITLRIVLVENLRRAAEGIVSRRAARQEADALADQLFGVDSRNGSPAAAGLRRFDHPAAAGLPSAFAVQLVQRLRDQDPAVTPALLWLDKRLAAQGKTADEIVREEHQRQAATNVTVRNVITSMRLMSAVDWSEFFESVSLVDEMLRAASAFAEMDFPTRDRYRHAIEELGRGSRHSELEIAKRAILAAKNAGNKRRKGVPPGRDCREQDPGYYLISKGRLDFEKQLGFRVPFSQWLDRAARRAGMPGYLARITIYSACILALPLLALAGLQVGGATLFGLTLLALVTVSDAAVALVNHFVTNEFGPKALPGLELRDGVPANLRTMVVVPTLLTTPAEIEEQIERLEVHYLSSSDGDFSFALLSDWTDSVTEHAPGDDELLAAAAAGIARLNQRHPAQAGTESERFFLLHRRRVWNKGEKKWIGWERKRGKLHELNRLLRGATDTTFLPVDGRPPTVPTGVCYVITIDADTRLPKGVATRLVGKMAHPLNRPRFDSQIGCVVEGYAVLQPRVTPSLPVGREGSIFQRIFSGPGGMDPYAFAVSDVYQDLFEQGSYTGKGIYDVDVFEAALKGRIPESTLLSHDLIEGIFAGAGLVSDIEVVEESPSRYDVAAARQHRWARGDWQLLPWIFGHWRNSTQHPRQAAIPLLGRWKMIDNLRRSLFAPATFLALSAGWLLLPLTAAAVWSAFLLFMIALPPLLPFLAGIVPRRPGISQRSHWRAVGKDFSLALSQIALMVTLLSHQAWLMTDAIVRTLFRLFVSRRRLLEWVTAAQTKLNRELNLRGFYLRMTGGVALAAVAAVLGVWIENTSLLIAAPFVIVWLLAPVAAWQASRLPPSAPLGGVTAADAQALRLIARRTWRFFETFVTSQHHMLPPDNFQEEPKPVVAHRTSPTNLGIYLLSVIAARDFGWLSTLDAVERLEATLATMNRLKRFRGHFYNWYDTQSLRPLDPKYISSVDSGNLAGHLIALANACRELIDRPLINPQWLAGIADALALTRESLRGLSDDRRTQTVTRKQLEEALDTLAVLLVSIPTTPAEIAGRLVELALQADTVSDMARTLTEERGEGAEVLIWAEAIRSCIASHARDCAEENALEGATPNNALARRLSALVEQAEKISAEMDFGFLFDPARHLLSIGYRVADGSLDPSCYDLLASEARLASFVAIAKGDVPVKHWFRLGRALTPVDRGAALISWSGSMFEYLMPLLVMREPVGSVLEQTSRLIVHRQRKYGAELGVPWGVSESAYNVRDFELTYQYSNFGVPGLGLKRGLSEDAVIAPYATALAAMVDAEAAVKNFLRLTESGARGRYGWYEALDYTRDRLPDGEPVAIVRSFMAHHQGMTLVAIANALHDGAMRARFHAEPIIQAAELLLQERTPRDIAVSHPRAEEVKSTANVRELGPSMLRRFHSPHDPVPRTHLLSNGRYTVMITAAGSGYSRWQDLAVTRWREDVTCDSWGTYIFLRDVHSGQVWSAGYQPSGVEPDSYEVTFSEDRAEIARRDGSITTTLEVAVSPEDDVEVRRVSISNLGSRAREIELTSYAEVVLAPPAADAAHPAFSKLFVQTEFAAEVGALLATRRRRSPSEPEVWAAHLAVVEGMAVGDMQFETDRARFLGRGHGVRTPIAVMDRRPLSNTVGTVLDPIFSLRCRVQIPPGTTVRVAFWTLIATSRSAVLDLADKHHNAAAFERAVTLAWTQAQIQLHHLGIDSSETQLFQRLANHVLYSDPALRPSSQVLRRNELGQPALWAHAISGDLPIVLVRIDEADDLQIVRQLLRAHEYWRMKRLAVDLVILNERPSSYSSDLQAALEAVLRVNESQLRPQLEGEAARGNVFLLRTDLISVEVRNLLRTVARAVLLSRRGSLSEQIQRLEKLEPAAAPPSRKAVAHKRQEPALLQPAFEFFNGLGGFVADGREYVTILGEGQWTPAPWVNVIANPSFGFQTSVEGAGYTWSINSRDNQLTPWSNDPVSDRPGEAIYLRDEDNGALWCPTALPIRKEDWLYLCRHGQGYSRFEHTSHGISLDLLQYVPLNDAIKISRLKIQNRSGRSRRLSITAYVEWVLAASRGVSAPFIVTEIDTETGAMFARNPWRAEFGKRVAFVDLAGQQLTWTGDRAEFIGRNGTLDHPAALTGGAPLSNRTGAGFDPCGALQTVVELKSTGAVEIVFFLGEAATEAEACALITRYRTADLDAVFQSVIRFWDDLLGTVQVKTPDRAMDILLNRWLLYQTLACRVWARAAFYQAGGAYGFRDQLQDVMALAVAKPEVARAHLLRAAGRQFIRGDVQHWWLPSSGQGVRTRISDNRIWLPYATAHYVEITNDLGLLDEKAPFLEGPALRANEHDAFFQPMISEKEATVFEHCARALDRSLAVGEHGLPLIGAGDWNDGMNRVGEKGKGESVWLGWFLHATLATFARLADQRGEPKRAKTWRQHAATLRESLEREAWDGDWYRRGYFDDGTPLGSALSNECRIDAIAQSWGVISGAANPARSASAMAATEEYLVRRDDGLVLLFTPPFDRTSHDPGYIKGYPPGIRENGGQYTHAAIWTVLAFAMLGDGDKAGELFSILNPINHANSRAAIHRYKVEPYVACADVYAVAPHVGRGGWTWYTGTAGWMYRVGLEWILGFRLQGATLLIDPCVPKAWRGFEIVFRYRSARYEIAVENPHGVCCGVARVELDGKALPGKSTQILLTDDGATHRLRVILG